jgi:DNA-binding NtrC family response regulator
VIVVTGYASAETAVSAMKEGAFDYITKPVNFEELLIVVRKALEQHSWPGNVRELENLVERLVALTEGEIIRLEDLPAGMRGQGALPGELSLELTGNGMDMVDTIARIERKLISQALELSGGVKAQAAQLLGINRTTLVEKVKRLKM